MEQMTPAKLALIELLDRDGSVRQSLAVTRWPVRLGRSLACDLVLDDPHVAPEHVQIDHMQIAPTAGAAAQADLQLQVLDSRNGVQARGQAWRSGQILPLATGDEWLMGRSRLRLRLAASPLAPELPLDVAAPTAWWAVPLALLALLLWSAAESYVRTDPDGFWTEYLGRAVGILGLLAVWSALWALASKLFQHRLVYWQHVWLATLALLAVSVLGLLLSLLAYMMSWEHLGRLDALVYALTLGALVYAHLRIVQPLKRRVSRWVAASLCALMLASSWGMSWYRQERLSSELYLAALFPPALRLTSGVTVEQFLHGAQSLQPVLEKKAKEAVDGVTEASGGEDDD